MSEHEPWCASRYRFESDDVGVCDCQASGKPPHEPSVKELVVQGWPESEKIAKLYAPPTFWAKLLWFFRL